MAIGKGVSFVDAPVSGGRPLHQKLAGPGWDITAVCTDLAMTRQKVLQSNVICVSLTQSEIVTQVSGHRWPTATEVKGMWFLLFP